MESKSPGHTPVIVCHENDTVIIDINGKPHKVRAGFHSVIELKKLGNIPLADELERVAEQRLIPLPDDGTVSVQECAWFVSHPRDCSSS